MNLVIRSEEPGDIEAIYELTKNAFQGRPYAGGDEQDVVNALRSQGALTLSLVAEWQNQIVGHAAFSPATTTEGSPDWFALGPISVSPDLQGKHVGSALMEAGLATLRLQGAAGCILTGNPAYYSRFGFGFAPEHVPEAEEAQYFMVLPMSDTAPDGRFIFHPSFYGPT